MRPQPPHTRTPWQPRSRWPERPPFRPGLELLEDRAVPSAAPVADSGQEVSVLPSEGADVVLAWNEVMLDANAVDHSLAAPDQGGPTRTTYAFAIVSAAVYDAANSISHDYGPYLTELTGFEEADFDAAVSSAAYHTLVELFPQQEATFNAVYAAWLDFIPDGMAEDRGVELGQRVAVAIFAERADDGSGAMMMYMPVREAGHHQPDPNNPGQGFHGPQWGEVDTFVIGDVEDFQAPPPPALTSAEYAAAYNQVLWYGGDGSTTPTLRTEEQTEIGIYWAYDGTPGLGTPPRLYNQIVQVIARDQGNTPEENARLFALVNLAMGDAAIQAWDVKYDYDFWRPVVGIRAGKYDGNAATQGDPDWNPLGAPFSNGNGTRGDFTPPFPAYTSGHATFGAAAFQTVANFYGTDAIAFDFVSDEFNGITTDANGVTREAVTRHFDSLSEATWENAISRIYLGIHWIFDAEQGIASGTEIANYVSAHALLPRDRELHFESGGEPLDVAIKIDRDVSQIVDMKTGAVLASTPTVALDKVVVVGADGLADRVTIYIAPGVPNVPDGIWVFGGAGGGDQVTLRGSTQKADTFVVNGTEIQCNSDTLHLEGVERLRLQTRPNDAVIVLAPFPGSMSSASAPLASALDVVDAVAAGGRRRGR